MLLSNYFLCQGYSNEDTDSRTRTVGQKGGERDKDQEKDQQAPKKKGKRSPKGKNKGDLTTSIGYSDHIIRTLNGDNVRTYLSLMTLIYFILHSLVISYLFRPFDVVTN